MRSQKKQTCVFSGAELKPNEGFELIDRATGQKRIFEDVSCIIAGYEEAMRKSRGTTVMSFSEGFGGLVKKETPNG